MSRLSVNPFKTTGISVISLPSQTGDLNPFTSNQVIRKFKKIKFKKFSSKLLDYKPVSQSRAVAKSGNLWRATGQSNFADLTKNF